jgi:hypothetical protein
MKIEGLELPAQLISLIEVRIWPRTDADFRAQFFQPRATKDRIRLLSPNEDHLDLMASESLCLLSTEIASYNAIRPLRSRSPTLAWAPMRPSCSTTALRRPNPQSCDWHGNSLESCIT